MILFLFVISMLASCGPPMMAAAAHEDKAGIWFHLNALGGWFCFTVLGLAMARSRIRLVVHHYEVKPSWMIVGILIFTPFVAGMATAVTFGYAGLLGLVAMGLVGWYADVTPKAASWVTAPNPNIPKPPDLPT